LPRKAGQSRQRRHDISRTIGVAAISKIAPNT
jgi:hypothetical protein